MNKLNKLNKLMRKSPALVALLMALAGFLAGLMVAGIPARAQIGPTDIQNHEVQILQKISDSLSNMDRNLGRIADQHSR